MTAQPSIASTAQETKNGGIAIAPQDAGELLGRLDTILDELYALRQVILHWSTSDPKTDAGDENVIQEAVAELVIESSQSVPTPDAKQAPITPMTDAAIRTAANAAWEKVYTNAEIADMRSRGEEIPPDLVSQLSGSLGPASPDEREYLTSFDFAWRRFSE